MKLTPSLPLGEITDAQFNFPANARPHSAQRSRMRQCNSRCGAKARMDQLLPRRSRFCRLELSAGKHCAWLTRNARRRSICQLPGPTPESARQSRSRHTPLVQRASSSVVFQAADHDHPTNHRRFDSACGDEWHEVVGYGNFFGLSKSSINWRAQRLALN